MRNARTNGSLRPQIVFDVIDYLNITLRSTVTRKKTRIQKLEGATTELSRIAGRITIS